MRLLFYVLCFSLFLTSPSRVEGQDTITLRTEILGVKDGLSQGLITCIMQDKEGLMWLGTKDGLNKYDGYNFTIYRHEQDNPLSLPDNYVQGFVEDDNGNFWVGTNSKGLCLFDKKNERFYPVKLKGNNDSLSNNNVNLGQCLDGKLLVTQNGQLIIYDVSHIHPGNYKSVDLSKATVCFDNRITLPANRNFNSYPFIMGDNSLWFVYDDSIFVYAPSDSGIYKLAKSFAASLPELGTIKGYSINELSQQRRLLFTGKKDLVVYDFANKKIIKKITFNQPFYDPLAPQKDNRGNYFIGELSGNGYYFNVTDYSLKPFKGKLDKESCIDRNGILWMGTSGGGVIKLDYRKQLFQTVPPKTGGSFKINYKGELVTGTNNQLVFFNPYSKAERSVFPPGIWNNSWIMTEFVCDNQGVYWILYMTANKKETHLFFYDASTGRMQDKKLGGLSIPYPSKLIIDRDDNLWINSFNAQSVPVLIKINKSTLATEVTYPISAKSQNNFGYFISSYWQDAHNVFWFATMQGLYSFDEEINKWQNWNNIPGDKNSLSNDYLLTILPDPKQPGNYLWLGSDGGGLSRFEISTNKFINFTDKDGLPNNVVYGLLSDKEGNIWMSTNKGICCFSPPTPKGGANGNGTNSPFGGWGAVDGLPGDEFNRNQYFRMLNGDLFFEGIEGGVVFNPEKILEKETAPTIVFTGLSVFNKPVTYKTDSDIIQFPITYAQTITLPHDKDMFSISFAALEYRAASKKHYKYFLEGYDKKWIEAGSKNEATYTNLSPGSYTFHVTGAGSTGVWSTKEATIKIIILPAWYQTWWFRLLVAVAVAVATYALYRYRLQKALGVQKIRNRIAADLHDEIGSTISSISLSSNIIQKKLNGNQPEVAKLVNQISDNTGNIMEVISDIVWTINSKNDSFANVVDRMRAFAIEILESKNIAIHFDIDDAVNYLALKMDKRKNLYLIFKECINNAAKYSQCNNVWIEIKLHYKRIILKIKDDGIGFNLNEKQQSKLSGNGLYNMQKRAYDMKGKLVLDSQPQQGTMMMLEFGV